MRSVSKLDSRIPFGLNIDSNQLVDVGSVERGSACRCVCPSCRTPLIARQGIQNAWHFAHRSQDTHNETVKECDFSFAFSVRLMIRQLATHGLQLKVPKLEGSFSAYCEHTYQAQNFDYQVTEERVLTLDDIQVGVVFAGETVDVLGFIENVPFVVHVTYRERKLPAGLCSPAIRKCGVIEINVDDLPQLFELERKGQYQEVLRKYIEEQTEGKKWAYHPREQRLMSIAMQERDLWLKQQKVAANINKSAHYTCRICGWMGPTITCEVCKSHLYTSNKI